MRRLPDSPLKPVPSRSAAVVHKLLHRTPGCAVGSSVLWIESNATPTPGRQLPSRRVDEQPKVPVLRFAAIQLQQVDYAPPRTRMTGDAGGFLGD